MEIKIGKTSRACFVTEQPFEHGDEIVSLIRRNDAELVREDYSKGQWRSELGEAAIAVWTTKYYDPKVAEQESPEVFSPLRQVFYEAVETADRGALAMAYLAAQLLRRQKVFRLIKEADAAEDPGLVILYLDRLGNRIVEVRDPNLTYDELEEGRKRLLTRLAELEQPDDAEEEREHRDDEQTS